MAAPPAVISEYEVWEDRWCCCAQELGQWETLSDFGKSQNGANPFLGEGGREGGREEGREGGREGGRGGEGRGGRKGGIH